MRASRVAAIAGCMLAEMRLTCCSMTSPQRHTTAAALPREPQQQSHAEEQGSPDSAAGRPAPRRQASQGYSTGDSSVNPGDRGHLFRSGSLGADKGHLSQLVSVPQATRDAPEGPLSHPSGRLTAETGCSLTTDTARSGTSQPRPASSGHVPSTQPNRLIHQELRQAPASEAAPESRQLSSKASQQVSTSSTDAGRVAQLTQLHEALRSPSVTQSQPASDMYPHSIKLDHLLELHRGPTEPFVGGSSSSSSSSSLGQSAMEQRASVGHRAAPAAAVHEAPILPAGSRRSAEAGETLPQPHAWLLLSLSVLSAAKQNASGAAPETKQARGFYVLRWNRQQQRDW